MLSLCVWSIVCYVVCVKFLCVKLLYVKLLYVKFVCVKFLYVKLSYVKFCMVSVSVRVWGRRREEKEEAAPGIQNQKQEPHTKMWGKNAQIWTSKFRTFRVTTIVASLWQNNAKHTFFCKILFSRARFPVRRDVFVSMWHCSCTLHPGCLLACGLKF